MKIYLFESNFILLKQKETLLTQHLFFRIHHIMLILKC